MAQRGIGRLLNIGIGARLTLILLIISVVSIAVLVYFSVNTILSAGESAQQASTEVLREQSKSYLLQLTEGFANNFDIQIEQVRDDARVLGDISSDLFSNPEAYNRDAHWLAADHMFVADGGQYMNIGDDLSSVFVPSSVKVTDELDAIIEQSAYLDDEFASVLQSNPNTVAVYLITKEDITRYYPNIILGEIVPPDYSPAADIFFQIGTPENNRNREVVWTPVYDDPADQGFLVSAIAPIYSDEYEFLGVIGIDLSLSELTETVQNAQIATSGYLFLVDSDGRILALPDQGKYDLFGVKIDTDLYSDDSSNLVHGFSPIIQRMVGGENGFQVLNFGDEEIFVAFAPLEGTGWSLASVTRADEMLRAGVELQEQLGIESRNLIRQQIVPYALAILIATLLLGWFLTNQMVSPIRDLAADAERIGLGDWNVYLRVDRQDEIGILASALDKMRDQLREAFRGLEIRVAQRTGDLELATEVGQSLSLLQDQETMLTEAVEMIRERFDLYYTQIYLLDAERNSLVLRAGTGDTGRTLLGQGHRLPLDISSLNGTAAVERRAVIVQNTEQSLIHKPNPLLPETRSEMVVPLIAGENVLGVLDMQSSQPGALNEDNLPAFDVLASQLAIAIINTNLFDQIEKAQSELVGQAQRLSRQGWGEFLDGIERPEVLGYTYDKSNTVLSSEPIDGLGAERALMKPIQIMGQTVGTFRFEGSQTWSDKDAELVASVSEQLSQQIENLRLLSESERYRQEAQDALKRLTREGWDQLRDETTSGYMYRDQVVEPIPVDADENSDQEEGQTFEIAVRDEVIGELNVFGLEHLSSQDQSLLAEINQQLGNHLDGLRLQQQTNQALSETEDQAGRLSALNELSEGLNHAETLHDIYRISSTQLIKIIDAERMSMTRLVEDEEKGFMLEVFALQGEAGAIPTGTKIEIADSAIGEAFQTRQVVVIPDLTDTKYLENAQLVAQGLQSSMVVPLVVGGQSLGTVNFGSNRKDAYDQRTRDLAVQAVAMMASTLENRNLLQQTQTALMVTEELFQGSERVVRAMTMQSVLESLVDTTVLHRMTRVGLVIYDHPWVDEDPPVGMTVMASWVPEGEDFRVPVGTYYFLEEYPLAKVFALNKPSFFEDLSTDERFDQHSRDYFLKELGVRGAVTLPLLVGGESIGGVVGLSRDPLEISDEEVRRTTTLTDQAASMIQNQLLVEQTQAALMQTDILYSISQALNEATNEDEILEAVVQPAAEAGAISANYVYLDLDEAGEPIWAEIVANWRLEGEPPVPIGTRYYLPDLPFSDLWISDPNNPVLVSDVNTDERIDDVSRSVMQQGGSRAIAIIPLTQAGERLGLLIFNFDQPHEFSSREKDAYQALIGLVSPVIRSRRIFEHTQREADQEALINVISQQIQSTTSVDDALQVAIRELGRALDAKWTSVKLG